MRRLSEKNLSGAQNIVSVYFRVDADESLGLGHLSRCRSLMLAFSNVAKCNFSIVSNNKNVVRKFISNVDFDLYDIKHSFKKHHFDIAIIDLPDTATRGREKEDLNKPSGLIACIDDEGPGLYCQDVLIRPNLLNLPNQSKMKIPLNNYWSGRDYIILHPDFITHDSQKINRSRKVKELLVCFGGSDPSGLTLRVIPLLKKLKMDIKIHIVLGAAFPWGKKVASTLDSSPCFSISYNISNMAQIFQKADVALISGGTLLYEACSLGVPSIVISQNKSQEKESKICHAARAVVNLGVNEAVSDNKIFSILQQVIEDGSLREDMAREGPKIVSPYGAMRIVTKLLSYAKERVG